MSFNELIKEDKNHFLQLHFLLMALFTTHLIRSNKSSINCFANVKAFLSFIYKDLYCCLPLTVTIFIVNIWRLQNLI